MSASVPDGHRTWVVTTLGVNQTISWASSYYVPAVLAVPMAREFGISNAWVFGAFSGALIVMALLGPFVGRQIDLKGGRLILSWSHGVLAVGLVLLAFGNGAASVAIAWGVLGVGMALGLYDAAFAALAGFYGREARRPMTGITLIAGFASTIGWPIHAVLENAYGWRTACLVWAAVHILICLPTSLLLLPRQGSAREPANSEPSAASAVVGELVEPAGRTTLVLLALMFSAAWFVTGAMATHLPRLLEAFGASPAAAIGAAALVGPAQVAARLVEFSFFGNVHPLVTARVSTLLHPIGAAVLALVGGPAAVVFTVLHGAGNGLLTIIRGTLPLALFGPVGYGLKQGIVSAPARFSQATAPLLFAVVLDASPMGAIILSSSMLVLSFALVMALGRTTHGQKGSLT